jgi:hypothetical protein
VHLYVEMVVVPGKRPDAVDFRIVKEDSFYVPVSQE